LAWSKDHLKDSTAWFNPWPMKYLTPVTNWLPIKIGPDFWETISSPPSFDEFGHRQRPKPPEGLPVYWWKLPRATWPYREEMPWEDKILGCWPASQVLMPEDLRPSIWPGKYTTPPFGFIKLKMPGPPEVSGEQAPKGNQILFNRMKIHMRWISPDEMKVKTLITPLGPKYYFESQAWGQHEYDYKEFRRAMRERRQARAVEMLAREIARTGGVPQPSKDLFS
jgi:hypothetical protein